jgi:hypothetical protein
LHGSYHLRLNVPHAALCIVAAPCILSQYPSSSCYHSVHCDTTKGLPSFDPTIKNEPPLEGKSLVPVLHATDLSPSSKGVRSRVISSDDALFNLSFSQYARARCPTDLFQPSCPAGSNRTVTHYNGFSVRYGARFPTEIHTRGSHWIPCMFA